jgi:hypothetical protein
MMEQPSSSQYYDYGATDFIRSFFNLGKVHTYMKCFRHWLPKPSSLLGRFPRILELARKWSKKRQEKFDGYIKLEVQYMREHGQLNFCRNTALKQYRKYKQRMSNLIAHYRSKTGWACGGKDLASTAVYTRAFVKAVLNLWELDKDDLLLDVIHLEPPASPLLTILNQIPFDPMAACVRKPKTLLISGFFPPKTVENEHTEVAPQRPEETAAGMQLEDGSQELQERVTFVEDVPEDILQTVMKDTAVSEVLRETVMEDTAEFQETAMEDTAVPGAGAAGEESHGADGTAGEEREKDRSENPESSALSVMSDAQAALHALRSIPAPLSAAQAALNALKSVREEDCGDRSN